MMILSSPLVAMLKFWSWVVEAAVGVLVVVAELVVFFMIPL